jgi:alpha-1,3/alpha-1,6-mannosyltransferase
MPKRVALLHLDLGIGGAERLMVDAALAMQSKGHKVAVYTTHCDPSHSFAETQDGSLSVLVRGDFLPRSLFSRFTLFCAALRMLYLSLYILLSGRARQVDVFFVDGVSLPVPLLRFFGGAPVLFYCHYPDLKLCVNRESALKRFYRAPFDWLESVTTRAADVVFVNSEFTGTVYRQTFGTAGRAGEPIVLYPPIRVVDDDDEAPWPDDVVERSKPFFVSLNRYEFKKNIRIAIEAQRVLASTMTTQSDDAVPPLVIAGGFDDAVEENARCLAELRALADETKLPVHFKFSISRDEKRSLLENCTAVLYTPENEHFGIVPIECMCARRPVIACNSGGPVETVLDGQTGYLCEPTPEAFGAAMRRLLGDRSLAAALGRRARQHIVDNFSLGTFANVIDRVLCAQA